MFRYWSPSVNFCHGNVSADAPVKEQLLRSRLKCRRFVMAKLAASVICFNLLHVVCRIS